jgi:hypothetical protein
LSKVRLFSATPSGTTITRPSNTISSATTAYLYRKRQNIHGATTPGKNPQRQPQRNFKKQTEAKRRTNAQSYLPQLSPVVAALSGNTCS